MLTFWLICIVTVATQNIANAEDVYEIETVHSPGAELGNAIRIVNQAIIEKLRSMLREGRMKRGDEQLDVFSSMFSKRSDPNMLHPNSEDESVNSLSQESHDPVLETRVLRSEQNPYVSAWRRDNRANGMWMRSMKKRNLAGVKRLSRPFGMFAKVKKQRLANF